MICFLPRGYDVVRYVAYLAKDKLADESNDDSSSLQPPTNSSASSLSSLSVSVSVSGGSLPQRRTGELELVQNETYALAHPPGPDPARQEAPHPHDAIVDPTGQYLLVPDLGADLIRVFKLDHRARAARTLTPLPPVVASPGSGPRHGAFVRVPATATATAPDVDGSRSRTFFYLVSELANTITGYEVTYYGEGEEEKLDFGELFTLGTHGEGRLIPEGAAAAEIQVTVRSCHGKRIG